MTREELINAMREEAEFDIHRKDLSDKLRAAADMLEADGVPIGQMRQKMTGNGGVEVAWGEGIAPAIGTKLYTAPQPAAPQPAAQERKPLTAQQRDDLWNALPVQGTNQDYYTIGILDAERYHGITENK